MEFEKLEQNMLIYKMRFVSCAMEKVDIWNHATYGFFFIVNPQLPPKGVQLRIVST